MKRKLSHKEELKKSAKNYITQIYLNHKEEDVESWSNFIDIIFIYIDEAFMAHERDTEHK